jgi:hypothetical protein
MKEQHFERKVNCMVLCCVWEAWHGGWFAWSGVHFAKDPQ